MKLTARVVAIAALAALAIIPLTSVAAATAPQALHGAPKVGRCYNVSGRIAQNHAATSAHTLACSKRHTLWVLAVTQVPKSVAAARGRNRGKAVPYFNKVCVPAIRRAIGSTDRRWAMSAYNGFWFLPTKPQLSRGAHWLSCELGVTDGSNRLAATTTRRPVKIGRHLPYGLLLCGTGKYALTRCHAKHAYRATYAFAVHRKLRTRSAKTAAHRHCPAHVKSEKWMYRSLPVARAEFFVTCLTKTTR